MPAEGIDGLILGVLCNEPTPWDVEELKREFREPVEVEDALARLLSRGLVLRMKGGFVITSAAGRYAHAIDGAALWRSRRRSAAASWWCGSNTTGSARRRLPNGPG